MLPSPNAEWLEADGLGGFASGTVSGIRTRRYHALLLTATTPPTGRFVLVNGFDAWIDTPNGSFALSSQRYMPEVIHPDGHCRMMSFTHDPWPRWRFHLEEGTILEHELFACHDTTVVALAWRLLSPAEGRTLSIRPFFSGRDYHALHHENPAFAFTPQTDGQRRVWHPYHGLPGIITLSNGDYVHQPDWYRNFIYAEEQHRGLDAVEDLATPGIFRWDLTHGEAILLLAAEGHENGALPPEASAQRCFNALRTSEERRRSDFRSPLHRAADAYIVRRGLGKTIVAGYPWFTDWGRDTFIALRGLALATGRVEEAGDILLSWAETVSQGMLPNRFPDHGDSAEFNSVDASLWYIIAVGEFLTLVERQPQNIPPSLRALLHGAIDAILTGYATGTRYGIRLDSDGLLAAGEPGQQLTWMDARVGDQVVTPRIGKPVEIQALWLNALHIASAFSDRWQTRLAQGRAAFQQRFWHAAGGHLYDVVDVDHQPGAFDPTFRPNQILAVGGLPISLVDEERAQQVVSAVEERLWTPLGLRSLAPGESGYVAHYQGGVPQRDSAYHQGTVWPWLIGPFVEAWVRVRGNTPEAKCEARKRFLTPLFQHLNDAGIGHIAEIADGDLPHTPRGCPFQAWSLGEVLRLELAVLSETA